MKMLQKNLYRQREKLLHSPNLSTILMVEGILKKGELITLAQLKKVLPKQVMHQTLIQILDYLQLSGKIIIGTKGTIYWEYKAFEDQKIELYGSDGTLRETLLQNEKFDVNDMYLQELRHFLVCVERGEQTCSPIASGAEALTIALNIR